QRGQGPGGWRSEDRQGRRQQGRSGRDQKEVRRGRRQGGDQVACLRRFVRRQQEGFLRTVFFLSGGAAQERANRAKGIRLRNSRPVLIPKSWTLFGPPAAVCAAIPGRSFRTTLIFLSLVSPFFARQGCRLRPGRSRR